MPRVDPVLVARARAGDEGALHRLVHTVSPTVRRWALARVGDPDDAGDVAQEALILMVRHLGSFEGRSSFLSWLFRIVRNRAVESARRRSREERRRERLAGQPVKEVRQPGDPERMDGQRLENLVRAFLSELPPRQREVFELVDLEGLTSPEVGEILGIEPATVRATLLRARRAIRSRILADHPEFAEEYRR